MHNTTLHFQQTKTSRPTAPPLHSPTSGKKSVPLIKPLMIDEYSQYDWIKSETRPILQRFVKHALAEKFIAMNLLPRENPLKEISEILTVWTAIKSHIPYKPEEKILALDVGSGISPRLGAWVALNTNWQVFSIDPVLLKPKAVLPDNLTIIAKPVEEVDLSQQFDLSEYHAVIMMIHAHVSSSLASKAVTGCKKLSMVAIPCCNYLPRQQEINGTPFNLEYEANNILSRHNLVRVWYPQSEPYESKKDVSKENPEKTKPLKKNIYPRTGLKRKIQHRRVSTTNEFTQYNKVSSDIDHFINHWEITFRDSRGLKDKNTCPQSWIFKKANMANRLSRAIHIEKITREILKRSSEYPKEDEELTLVVFEEGKYPRYGAWLACSLKHKVIAVCRSSKKRSLAQHWQKIEGMSMSTKHNLEIKKQNYHVIVMSSEFKPEQVITLLRKAHSFSMIFNNDYQYQKNSHNKPDESRLIWDVISPIRRFHIWNLIHP